jgi:hypothetical protein
MYRGDEFKKSVPVPYSSLCAPNCQAALQIFRSPCAASAQSHFTPPLAIEPPMPVTVTWPDPEWPTAVTRPRRATANRRPPSPTAKVFFCFF